MRKVFSILTVALLYAAIAFGRQAAVDIPITVSDNAGNSKVLNFGLDTSATTGIDTALGESDLPPFPPAGVYEARWDLSPFGVGNLSTYKDYRNAPAFPFTGQKEHRLWWQLGTGATTLTVTYNLPAGATIEITDAITGTLFDSGILSGSGSYTITANVTQAKFFANYTNIGPTEPGPIFSVTPTSLDFGNVGVGNNSTETLVVSNPGTTNALQIDSVNISNADYTMVPNPPASYPITIAAGGSYNFDVTFTPAAAGTSSGNISFYHNAPGSPTLVPVTGVGTTQGGDLVFNPQTRVIYDNTQGYSNSIELNNYVGDSLKALQFKIVLDGVLLFRSIARGSAIPAPDWNFSYSIKPGNMNTDGSRNDTINVVLVGNGATQLPPGTGYEIATFQYDAINIQDSSEQTTVHFENVIGATGTPNPGQNAGIVAGSPQQITINNRVLWGDVNFDDRVDILDMLLEIDDILGNVHFTPAQLVRGDVAPWTQGNPAPTGDGEINAMDLALLQNIILTGQYPSGVPANKPGTQILPNIAQKLQKIQTGDDASLTFYINESGITLNIESLVAIKGLQVNFSSVNSSTSGMKIQTAIGKGYYYQSNDILRTLVYDLKGKSIEPGQYLYMNMPFTINNPRDIKIDDIVLAGKNDKQIDKISVQVIYSNAPELPTDYSLTQNYPNPFNPTTTMKFTVPKQSDVSIVIYNMLGQEVRTLFSNNVPRGTYTLHWDGMNNSGIKVSSGTYIYRMTAGDFVQSKKMILLK